MHGAESVRLCRVGVTELQSPSFCVAVAGLHLTGAIWNVLYRKGQMMLDSIVTLALEAPATSSRTKPSIQKAAVSAIHPAGMGG